MAKNEVLGNLVWLDLEMTGLVIETDVILEIATVITDGNLNVIAEGPSYAIHQPEEKLTAMGKWCQDQHGKTGLIEAVRNSTISLQYAEQQTLAFIKQYCAIHTGILSGNTVWQDRVFLDKYMPSVSNYLHYRIIDVTSIKELVKRWYPADKNIEFKKSDRHRALSDVYESMAELNHYRKNFFKPMG
ncbi:MAG TPA: oligoribonuclease [Candidatus Babeliales bacterium]|jgi:oligoribonuclease|nr:oligoribonuclease [Candidatus Babeliales bacterium]